MGQPNRRPGIFAFVSENMYVAAVSDILDPRPSSSGMNSSIPALLRIPIAASGRARSCVGRDRQIDNAPPRSYGLKRSDRFDAPGEVAVHATDLEARMHRGANDATARARRRGRCLCDSQSATASDHRDGFRYHRLSSR